MSEQAPVAAKIRDAGFRGRRSLPLRINNTVQGPKALVGDEISFSGAPEKNRIIGAALVASARNAQA